jgi:hypothetical protein
MFDNDGTRGEVCHKNTREVDAIVDPTFEIKCCNKAFEIRNRARIEE